MCSHYDGRDVDKVDGDSDDGDQGKRKEKRPPSQEYGLIERGNGQRARERPDIYIQ